VESERKARKSSIDPNLKVNGSWVKPSDSVPLHEAFQRTRNDFDWDDQIEACDSIRGLTAAQQQEARRALEQLKELLRHSFCLEKAGKRGHPIAYLVINAVAWTRLRLVYIANALKAAEAVQGIDGVLRRLKQTSKAKVRESVEALSLLELGYKFMLSGFEISFEPGLNSGKHPDLSLIDQRTGEKLFAEITALNYGDRFVEAQAFGRHVQAIFLSLQSAGDLVACIQFERTLAKDDLTRTKRRIAQLATEARRTQSIQTTESLELKVAVAPVDAERELITWAKARDLELGAAGPRIELDGELRRLTNKVKKKMNDGQLPKQHPGIVVVTIDHSLLPYSSHVREIVESLAARARRYPHLLCVIVHRTYLAPGAPIAVDLGDGALLIDKAVADPLREQIIIVPNEGYHLQTSPLGTICAALR